MPNNIIHVTAIPRQPLEIPLMQAQVRAVRLAGENDDRQNVEEQLHSRLPALLVVQPVHIHKQLKQARGHQGVNTPVEGLDHLIAAPGAADVQPAVGART